MSKTLELLRKKLEVKIKLAQAKAAKALAESIPDVIKIRTRQEGEGVNGKLKAIQKTVEYRDKYADNLSSDTSPSTSNLTATGQLLDAIKGKNAGSKITVEIRGGKRKVELSGGKSTKTNKEVRKFVEDNGREFLELSKDERKEAAELAKDIILEEIRSVIK